MQRGLAGTTLPPTALLAQVQSCPALFPTPLPCFSLPSSPRPSPLPFWPLSLTHTLPVQLSHPWTLHILSLPLSSSPTVCKPSTVPLPFSPLIFLRPTLALSDSTCCQPTQLGSGGGEGRVRGQPSSLRLEGGRHHSPGITWGLGRWSQDVLVMVYTPSAELRISALGRRYIWGPLVLGGLSVKGPEALQQLTESPKTPSYWGIRITVWAVWRCCSSPGQSLGSQWGAACSQGALQPVGSWHWSGLPVAH